MLKDPQSRIPRSKPTSRPCWALTKAPPLPSADVAREEKLESAVFCRSSQGNVLVASLRRRRRYVCCPRYYDVAADDIGSRVLMPNNLHTSTPPSGKYDNDKPISGMRLEENVGLPCGAFDMT